MSNEIKEMTRTGLDRKKMFWAAFICSTVLVFSTLFWGVNENIIIWYFSMCFGIITVVTGAKVNDNNLKSKNILAEKRGVE